MSQQSKIANKITAASFFISLAISISCPLVGSSVQVPHFNMEDITQYQDSLSPDDYASLLERARQIESMIQSSPLPKTIDAHEYKQAIQTLKQDTKEKVEERRNELDESTRKVNEEFDRTNRTYDSYSRDLNEEQKDELEKSVQDLLSKWKDPDAPKKGVNEGLKDCSEILQKLKEVNDKIVDGSMNRNRLGLRGSSESEAGKQALGQSKDESDSRDNWPAEPVLLRPVPPLQGFRYSAYLKSTARERQTPEDRLAVLQKKLDILRGINVLGTLEYDSFSQELNSLTLLSRKLKGADGLHSAKNEQILMDKVNTLEHAISRAAEN